MHVEELIHRIPKVELHLHIEGTLEPELVFELAARNGIALRYRSVTEMRAAYDFTDLQSFLDLYYECAEVLRGERDFYDMTRAYFARVHRDNVRYAEIFFDPQTHMARGVPFATVIDGIRAAQLDATRTWGLRSRLILCFLRHRSADEAMQTLEQALPYREWLAGVGLDSSEVGHPPEKFAAVFARARAAGLRAVAHAGEEGPPEYIRQALERLGAERIDHGVRCLEDEALVAELRDRAVPLTVCPLSNVRLRVVERMEDHPLKILLDRGLRATINSDDPAYFGGYVTDNYLAAQRALGLDQGDVARLCANAIDASFAGEEEKRCLRAELAGFLETA